MKKEFCLEVSGAMACFTRPEMKVERVSYDAMTPSAARSVFEAIFWKPEVRWRIQKIEVLHPIRWISIRRNEVAAKASLRNAQTAMNAGSGNLALYIEDERQQRAGLFLRDVAYRLHAELLPVHGDALENPAKYREMFLRRAEKGQCVNQPYLGCREFAARFRRPAWLRNLLAGLQSGTLFDRVRNGSQQPAALLLRTFNSRLVLGAIPLPP